jgi:hypothetical protein
MITKGRGFGMFINLVGSIRALLEVLHSACRLSVDS